MSLCDNFHSFVQSLTTTAKWKHTNAIAFVVVCVSRTSIYNISVAAMFLWNDCCSTFIAFYTWYSFPFLYTWHCFHYFIVVSYYLFFFRLVFITIPNSSNNYLLKTIFNISIFLCYTSYDSINFKRTMSSRSEKFEEMYRKFNQLFTKILVIFLRFTWFLISFVLFSLLLLADRDWISFEQQPRWRFSFLIHMFVSRQAAKMMLITEPMTQSQ